MNQVDVAKRLSTEWGLLSSHPVTTLSGIGAGLALFKVARVSHFHAETVHLLLSRQPLPTILLGTLGGAVPTLIGLFVLILLMEAPLELLGGRDPTSENKFNLPHIFIASLVFVAFVSFVPWHAILITFVIWIVPRVLVRLIHSPRLNRLAERLNRKAKYGWLVLSLVAVVPYLIITFIIEDDVWLPGEVIVTESNSYVGYVVEESDSSVVLIDEQSRLPVRITLSFITSRSFCRIATPWLRPFYATVIRERNDSLTRCDVLELELSNLGG